MQFMVTSKKDGFRRCGVAWPKGPTVFDEARFTPEEWAALKAEPMLIVTEIPAPPEAEPEPEVPETPESDREKVLEASNETPEAEPKTEVPETPEAELESAAGKSSGKARKPKE